MSSGGAAFGKSHIPQTSCRVAVIGGGVAGLAAAYRLHKRLPLLGRPYELHVLEASDRVGGIIRTVRRDQFILECGPDSFLAEKRRGIGLCDEVGLRRELLNARESNRRSFVARGKKLVPVPEGFYLLGPTRLESFVFSSVLSWRGKLRLLKEPWVPFRIPAEDEDEQTDESLASFVKRRLGPEALERLAQPLVAGIYAADPDTLSLRATFPQFLEMEKSGGVLKNLLRSKDPAKLQASGARYGSFVAPREGMEVLPAHLLRQLPPNTVHLQTAVRSLSVKQEPRSITWQILCEDGRTLEVDAVCLTLPAFVSAYLLQAIDPKLSQLLNTIPYADSATLNFAFRKSDITHPMNGFGFVVPAVEKRFISACTFSHQKFDGRAPKGHVLLRVFVPGSSLARFTGDDGEMERRALMDLRDLLGVKAKPLFSLISRYRRALPQYTVGHLQRLQQIKQRSDAIPGVALAGAWLRGVGIPDCIETAEEAADALWTYLSPS